MTVETYEPIVRKPHHREATRLLRWLQKVISKDESRPSITGMCLNGKRIITTDGFRIHEADVPACLATVHVNGTIDDPFKLMVKPTKTVTLSPAHEEFEVFSAKFPDYSKIQPESPAKFQIAVNPKYLKEALDIPNEGTVILSFWNCNMPFMVSPGENDNNAEAIIMPMWIEGMTKMPEPFQTEIPEVTE